MLEGNTMFATAAMGVVFLAPLALIALFVFMLKSNRTILSLVPLALLIVFMIFYYNEIMQMVDIVIHHSLIWMIPLIILVLLLLRSIGILAKFVIIIVGCAAGLFIQFGVLMPATKDVVNPFDFSTNMTSAMLYRYSGGSVDLNNSDLEDLKSFLAETEMYEDVMEKAKYEVVNDDTVWYMVDATLDDGSVVRVTVFPQGDEPDVLRIESVLVLVTGISFMAYAINSLLEYLVYRHFLKQQAAAEAGTTQNVEIVEITNDDDLK